MTRRGWVAAAALAAAVGGCSGTPPSAPPGIAMPVAFKEAAPFRPAQPADDAARGDWWVIFQDATLDRLEAQVDPANPTLAAADASYQQARALADRAAAGLFPLLAGTGGLSTNKQSAHRPLRSKGQPTYFGANTLALQASYEPDLWGDVHDAVAAGAALAESSRASRESVRLILHAELAADYIALRGLDAEAKLLQDTVVAYGRALDLTRARAEGDIASGLDVSRAETQLDTAKAQQSDVAGRRAELEHAIARLVGVPASSFSLPPDLTEIRLPEVPPGLPSDLLLRRPDVAAAERRIAAANQLIGVASAAFYPHLTLGALGGTQDTGLSLLALPESFWAVGPSISLPIFDGGVLRANLAGAKAGFEAAAADYRAAVLEAIQETEDSLAFVRWLTAEAADQDQAVAAAQKTLDLSLTLYRDGAVSYLEVVTAQAATLEAQEAALSLRTRRLAASVALIRAIGGGWATPERTAAAAG